MTLRDQVEDKRCGRAHGYDAENYGIIFSAFTKFIYWQNL